MCVMVIVGLPPICWKFTDFRVCPNTSTSSLGVWSSTSITIHSDHTSSWFEQNPLCHSVLSWEKYISPPVLRRWSWSSLHKTRMNEGPHTGTLVPKLGSVRVSLELGHPPGIPRHFPHDRGLPHHFDRTLYSTVAETCQGGFFGV